VSLSGVGARSSERGICPALVKTHAIGKWE
jgi:hypothetical protein